MVQENKDKEKKEVKKLLLRLPVHLRLEVKELAKKKKVLMRQLIWSYIAKGIFIDTKDYVNETPRTDLSEYFI